MARELFSKKLSREFKSKKEFTTAEVRTFIKSMSRA